jgi:predicted permease
VVLKDRGSDGAPLEIAYGNYVEVAERSRSFAALAIADRWQPALIGTGEPARLAGDLVTPDYFRVLGVGPSVGRGFEPADDLPGAPRVAIVSTGFAQRHFGSAEGALDRRLSLDGEVYSVIGVMPEEFENALAPPVEIWAPRRYRAQAPFESPEWGHHLRMIGRLREGVTAGQAQQELIDIGRAPTPEFERPSWAALERGLVLEPLHTAVTGEVRPALLAILGAVLLLLTIACANVTNILLARALARRGELAMRAALGASRGRLARHLFAETALVAALGGGLGVGVAVLATQALVALAPETLPRFGAVGLDARVFAMASATTVAFALFAGLVPALRAREVGTPGTMRVGARATTPRSLAPRRALVVLQVALATVLLASAGLLLRSVERLFDAPTGFDGSRVVTMRVVAIGNTASSSEEAQVLFERAVEAVRGVPGVAAAAFTSQLPLGGDLDTYGVAFESGRDDPAGEGGAFRYTVTPSWFETMRIPLVRGRLLGAEDRPGLAPAVLINESFAARRFAGRDPLGARIRLGPDISRPDRPWGTIVGVVGDVKQGSLAAASPDAFYVAMGQWSWVDRVQSLVVRTATDPERAIEPIKQALWSVDPTLVLERILTMDALVARSEAQRTFALNVFAAFGIAALLLAGVGVYGIIEARVAERTRELGVRAALGAAPDKLAIEIVSQGLSLTMAGIVLGVLGAVGATRAIAALLFGIAPFDPVTYLGVVLVLLAVAFVACYAPARRAARIDPAVTLRAE